MSAYLSYELPVKKLTPTAKLPDKANLFDAGLDLYCDETEVVVLNPGERRLFSTGIAMGIPRGFAGFIWPRSGLAVNKGIDRRAGAIDSTYRGEVKLLLINEDSSCQIISPGDKIAQIVIQFAPDFTPIEVEDLDSTSRGDKGFGSSGQ